MPRIISNTTCLIVLDNISQTHLLKQLFGDLLVPVNVAREYGKPLPDYISVANCRDENLQKALEMLVDPGEAAAIALALETQESLLILDDLKARKLASKLHLKHIGTIGLIIMAHRRGIVAEPWQIFEKMRLTGFRMPKNLQQVLDEYFSKTST